MLCSLSQTGPDICSEQAIGRSQRQECMLLTHLRKQLLHWRCFLYFAPRLQASQLCTHFCNGSSSRTASSVQPRVTHLVPLQPRQLLTDMHVRSCLKRQNRLCLPPLQQKAGDQQALQYRNSIVMCRDLVDFVATSGHFTAFSCLKYPQLDFQVLVGPAKLEALRCSDSKAVLAQLCNAAMAKRRKLKEQHSRSLLDSHSEEDVMLTSIESVCWGFVLNSECLAAV